MSFQTGTYWIQTFEMVNPHRAYKGANKSKAVANFERPKFDVYYFGKSPLQPIKIKLFKKNSYEEAIYQ